MICLAAGCRPEPHRQGLTQVVEDALRNQPASFAAPDATRRRAIGDAVVALAAGATPPRVPEGYELVRLHDASGPVTALLEVGRPRRGDGTYVVRPRPRTPLVIEAPHPGSDEHTELIAAQLFSDSAAEGLLIAGSRRDAGPGASADAAHAESTAFAAVDARLAAPGATIVQIHGFAAAKHPGYPPLVLSDGSPTPASWVSTVARSLAQAGFSACVFHGSVCRDLGATQNIEADHARRSGARFLHVEIDGSVRESPEARHRVSLALALGLRLAAGHPPAETAR